MVSVPKNGATSFIPLTELIENLDTSRKNKWNQLWMLSDRRTGPVHPLIYKHPITEKPVSIADHTLANQITFVLTVKTK